LSPGRKSGRVAALELEPAELALLMLLRGAARARQDRSAVRAID
jgi:hypothetical protein